MPYCGKRFWTRQILTFCLPTQLVFIHIERICKFFSATIDGRDLIFGHKLHIGTPYRRKRFWTHQIPTSCLPKSGDIIGEHQITVHLVKLENQMSKNLYFTDVKVNCFCSSCRINHKLKHRLQIPRQGQPRPLRGQMKIQRI